MRSSLAAIQTAIYQRLTTTTLVTQKVTGVFDEVPQNQAFPYIVIGDDTASPWYSKTTDGQEVITTIHTWSKYKGYKELKSIHNEIVKAISSTPLSVAGYRVEHTNFQFEEVFNEDEGTAGHGIRHGVVRFRFLLEEV